MTNNFNISDVLDNRKRTSEKEDIITEEMGWFPTDEDLASIMTSLKDLEENGSVSIPDSVNSAEDFYVWVMQEEK